MARVAAVLSVIVRSAVRNVRSVGRFLGNNFFVVIAILMAEEPADRPSSTSFFYLAIGLLYAIPLASELTLRIPADRFAVWPLTRAQRAIIYAANLLFNPLLVVAILFAALSRHPGVWVGLLLSGLAAPPAAYVIRFVAGAAHHFDRLSIFRLIPMFPGRLGGLIQNHVREQLRMLDMYFAAALSLGGIAYRLLDPRAEAMATPVIGCLLLIMTSTLGQSHLSFDGDSENARARLLPISGMAALFAKDAAWLSIVAVIAAPYASLPVAMAALMVLAAGHCSAARPRIAQLRAHFSSGTLWPVGIAQIAAVIAAAVITTRFGVAPAPLFAAVYFASLVRYGRKWVSGPSGGDGG